MHIKNKEQILTKKYIHFQSQSTYCLFVLRIFSSNWEIFLGEPKFLEKLFGSPIENDTFLLTKTRSSNSYWRIKNTEILFTILEHKGTSLTCLHTTLKSRREKQKYKFAISSDVLQCPTWGYSYTRHPVGCYGDARYQISYHCLCLYL